jgi:hypothetical protein
VTAVVRPRDRSYGFRFAATDAVILVAAAVACTLLWPLPGRPAVPVAFVVAHFFVFCNVVRLRRGYELIWAGAFVACVLALILLDRLGWSTVMVCVTPITVALVVAEVRSPRYHGVLCRRPPRR